MGSMARVSGPAEPATLVLYVDPLDLTGTKLLFRFIAAAYERRALGIASR